MEQRQVITVPQLFGMLFISRMIVNITYNPFIASTGEVSDHVLSAIATFFLTFLLIIPLWFLYRKDPSCNIIDHSTFLMGKAAVIVAFVYTLYFVVAGCYILSFFDTFVANVMSPKTSLWMLSGAVMVTAVYGAIRGVEALARTSGILLIGICASLVFVVCALFPKVDPVNYTPPLYHGTQGFWDGILLMVARSTSIPMLAILLPFAKGNKKKGFIVWNIATYLTIGMMLLLMEGALGDYLKTQIFPVYAATSVAQIGMFKRLDALYLGIWTTGLFVQMAAFLFCISHCITRVLGRKAGRIAIFVCGAVIAVMSVLITNSRGLARFVYNTSFLLYATLGVGVLIPLIFVIAVNVKKKKGEAQYEA